MSVMSCEQALELLMDFLKRELPAEVAATVQHHLERCKPCEGHARFEARFVLVIGDRLGKERCPDQLKHRIADLLAREGTD